MTSSFRVQYTRYGNGKREMSGLDFVQATNFAAAVIIAERLIEGMRNIDPNRQYDIYKIEYEQMTGEKCDPSGLALWQREDENFDMYRERMETEK